jgi:hypothetical protein
MIGGLQSSISSTNHDRLSERQGSPMADDRLTSQLPGEEPGSMTGPAISGIEGWLLLPAFSLIAGPLWSAYSIYLNATFLDTSLQTDLRAVLLLENILLSGMVLFQVYVAAAFFQRKSAAPNLVIALLIARVVFNIIDWLAMASITRESPDVGTLLGSSIAAGIWIAYFKRSRRVKATFVFGRRIDKSVARPVVQEAPSDPISRAPKALRRPQTGTGSIVLDPGRIPCPTTDERITALPVAAATAAGDDEWHVIHAGKEVGPLSLAELVGKAALGEIDGDDLVKKADGLWTKARDFGFLQQQFLLKGSGKEASPGLPSVSSPSDLVICVVVGGVLLAFLISLGVLANSNRAPSSPAPDLLDSLLNPSISKSTGQAPPSRAIKDADFFLNRGQA